MYIAVLAVGVAGIALSILMGLVNPPAAIACFIPSLVFFGIGLVGTILQKWDLSMPSFNPMRYHTRPIWTELRPF